MNEGTVVEVLTASRGDGSEDQAMLDATTQKPLTVYPNLEYGPFMLLPLDQLADVRRLLDEHGMRYEVEDNAISIDGGPMTVAINFKRGTEAETVRAILDSAH
jgi:hypothetical protein